MKIYSIFNSFFLLSHLARTANTRAVDWILCVTQFLALATSCPEEKQKKMANQSKLMLTKTEKREWQTISLSLGASTLALKLIRWQNDTTKEDNEIIE